MSTSLSTYTSELHQYYQSLLSSPFYSIICDIILPVYDPLDFAVQLPINVFLLATIPFRFLFCMLFDFQINFKCVIYNMFPFLSAFCPLLSTQPLNCQEFYQECCYQSCSNLANSNNPVISFLTYVCNNCSQSIFNYITCVMSYTFLDAISPVLVLLYPIFGAFQITPPCLFPSFDCFLGEPS